MDASVLPEWARYVLVLGFPAFAALTAFAVCRAAQDDMDADLADMRGEEDWSWPKR